MSLVNWLNVGAGVEGSLDTTSRWATNTSRITMRIGNAALLRNLLSAPPGGSKVAASGPQSSRQDRRRHVGSAGSGHNMRAQAVQTGRADARHLQQLLHRGEAAVGGAPLHDARRQGRADAVQPVQILRRGRDRLSGPAARAPPRRRRRRAGSGPGGTPRASFRPSCRVAARLRPAIWAGRVGPPARRMRPGCAPRRSGTAPGRRTSPATCTSPAGAVVGAASCTATVPVPAPWG